MKTTFFCELCGALKASMARWQHNAGWQSNYRDGYNSNYRDWDTVLSKKMTQVLRHTADTCGLVCRADGYVTVRQMLAIFGGTHFQGFTSEDVVRVVRRDKKIGSPSHGRLASMLRGSYAPTRATHCRA